MAEQFAAKDPFMVVLGDNVISENVGKFVRDFKRKQEAFKAKILVAKVKDPEKYGVVSFKGGKIIEIIEKPQKPKTSYVNTGLWMFQPEVFGLLKKLKKSPRGEYEITDIFDHYAQRGQLSHSILRSTWTDAGSFESLYNATLLMKKREESKRKKK